MNLEFLSVSAHFQPHTPFDFLIESVSQFWRSLFLPSVKMSSPFVHDPVDEEAAAQQLLRRELNIHWEIVIRLFMHFRTIFSHHSRHVTVLQASAFFLLFE